MSDLTGQILANRYRVDTFIGRGGMAEVYKVWDSNRMTFLAMKLLHEDLAIDRIFMRRFQREAQTLAKLQHPNIVRFYGLEQDGPYAFMLLDFIEGRSLKRAIFDAGGPMPTNQIRKVMRSVCSALQFAHREGLTHCDIKPGNIMIDHRGDVLLSDFGIARMTDAATATMVGMGTPAYMAPEQILGQDPTPQTDIYALGIVLFEVLTGGERPFTGEHANVTGTSSEKVRWEQMNLEAPSPRKWNPEIPPDVEAVIRKCLEKKPEMRFFSALDILNSTELAFGGEKITKEMDAKPIEPIPGFDNNAAPITEICMQCGSEIKPDWQTCLECGTKLGASAEQDNDLGDISPPEQKLWRRIPKWAIVTGSIIVALMAAVVITYTGFGFHRTNQAAKFAPDDSIALITFSPGPTQLFQLVDYQTLVNAAPVFAAVPGVAEIVMTFMDNFQDDLAFDPIDDLLPWIGREISLVILPKKYNSIRSQIIHSPQPFLITLASRNPKASEEFMLNLIDDYKFLDYKINNHSYHGYRITEIISQSKNPLAIANHDQMIIIASDYQVLQTTIDQYQGEAENGLFTNEIFKEFLRKLPGNRLGYTYINIPSVISEYRLESSDFPLVDQLHPIGEVGASIVIDNETLVLDYLIGYEQSELSPIQHELLSQSPISDILLDYSPDNTLLYFGGQNLSLIWKSIASNSLWETEFNLNYAIRTLFNWQYGEVADLDDFFDGLDDVLGVHPINDLVDQNSNEYSLMVVSDLDGLYGNKELPIGLLLAAKVDNPEINLNDMHKFINGVYQYIDVDHYSEVISGSDVWFVEDVEVGVHLGYTIADDVLLLGTSEKVLRDALEEGISHFGDSQTYQNATNTMSAKKNQIVFFNVEDILRHTRGIIENEIPGEVDQLVDSIRAISISSTPMKDDGWLEGTISILTR